MRKTKALFVGPVLTASGYGVHARQLLTAMERSGKYDLYVEPIRWGETSTLNGPDTDWIRKLVRPVQGEPDLAVLVTIPNEFKRRARLTVGVTAGIEVDRVSPTWLVKCNEEVDLVVVPSYHSAQAFSVEYRGSDGSQLRLQKPLVVTPEGVDTDVFKPASSLVSQALSGDRESPSFGVSKEDDAEVARAMLEPSSPLLSQLGVRPKNFVCVGLGLDKPDGRDRKNITKLVEWFCKEFAGRTDVGLVLKVSIVGGSLVDFDTTRKRIADIKAATGCGPDPSIFLLHGRVLEQELAQIYRDRRVIAMVSPTHGEGFGLPLIEAAACGLPVIATGWSGHVDFLTKDGRPLYVPLQFDLAEVPGEVVWQGVIDQGTRWANVKEQDLRSKLTKMVLNDVTPRSWADELAKHVAENYSLQKTGENFVRILEQASTELRPRPLNRDQLVEKTKEQVRADGPCMVYTMPMSAGDVFLSLALLPLLKEKHPGMRLAFATLPQYRDIVEGHPCVDQVIEWQPWMQDVSMLEDVYDEVYTPNLAVQMGWSNWVHKGKGRHLVDEFAVQCGLDPSRLTRYDSQMADPEAPVSPLSGTWVAVHSGGQKTARRWMHWTELVKNLRSTGVQVVQIGASDDVSVGEVDLDIRGKLSFKQVPAQLRQCKALVGIDSFPMHVANSINVQGVYLFGSSYPDTTGPYRAPNRLTIIETNDRHGCDRACYKDICKVDASDPCINEIDGQRVYDATMKIVGSHLSEVKPYQGFSPKIAGYTHILNPKTHGYPYLQSIVSMLGFCDEVIVVDGGSTDGSLKAMEHVPVIEAALYSKRLKVIERKWDPDEPGMDGMQKAFGRAMVSADVDFLWQQDADEVVHERDYERIKKLAKRFPDGVDVIHLPVVELWGDSKTCRTDRHSWKWRMSRNNFRVTHGINIQARVMDPKTGRFYAKRGMSDGCEYIDIVTGEHLPHAGFYSEEFERLRRDDPQQYGEQMNLVFEKLPSVWHYSWADLPRKIRNFRDFWDKQWQTLYMSPPEPRFPDVQTDGDVEAKAKELLERGGEHSSADTFQLKLKQPKIMEQM